MIKLKQVLQEFTDMNFEMKNVKDKNSNKVIAVLKKLGFGISAGDVKAARNRLEDYEGGKMFKHMQYHVVEDKKRENHLPHMSDVYFIYQTQHYEKDISFIIMLASYIQRTVHCKGIL